MLQQRGVDNLVLVEMLSDDLKVAGQASTPDPSVVAWGCVVEVRLICRDLHGRQGRNPACDYITVPLLPEQTFTSAIMIIGGSHRLDYADSTCRCLLDRMAAKRP